MKKYHFYVHGMHCKSCEFMIEDKLKDLPNVVDLKSSFKINSLEITGDFGEKIPEQIAQELTRWLDIEKYTISIEKQKHSVKWEDFKVAIPIALAFGALFVFLQKLGIVNLVNANNFNYGTAFAIGVVASVSSCMAVVGGVLLSMSATFAKEDTEEEQKSTDVFANKYKPQILFHAGRIISFFILGGVIGAIGSAFTLSPTSTFVLSLIVATVMLILGINLLDVFSSSKKLLPSMPKSIAKRAHDISKFNYTYMPVLVGITTFFLPCGFTQSMQLYTLTTGTFWKGGLTMLSFALGTFPVLALISFSSFSIKDSSKSGIFFKTAGLIVIMFALFNIINSLVAAGVISPIFNF